MRWRMRLRGKLKGCKLRWTDEGWDEGHAVKLQKYWFTHNFFNFDCNTGMLQLKMMVLMRGIQLNKNFSNLSNPVLTNTQNDKKLHILDSNSLVILSIWAYNTQRNMYWWV